MGIPSILATIESLTALQGLIWRFHCNTLSHMDIHIDIPTHNSIRLDKRWG